MITITLQELRNQALAAVPGGAAATVRLRFGQDLSRALLRTMSGHPTAGREFRRLWGVTPGQFEVLLAGTSALGSLVTGFLLWLRRGLNTDPNRSEVHALAVWQVEGLAAHDQLRARLAA